MRVYLGVSNHLSPLKAESFLYLVAEVEARDLKQKKDLLYYGFKDGIDHVRRKAVSLKELRASP